MDLIEALDAVNVKWRRGRDDTEIYMNCPFCSDSRFRLGVNLVTGRAGCFNDDCEWRGYGEFTFNKIQEALDTGVIEAKERKRKKKKRKHMDISLPDGFELLQSPNGHADHWNDKAWRFVRSRGVTSKQIEHKKIGYTVLDKYAYRIILPIRLSGKLVGFVGRDFIGNQDPKYKNSIGAKCIYNLPEKKKSTICLSEGAFDALAIERVSKHIGIDSGGLLGHSITDEQLHLLRHYDRLLLWMDPDEAGIEGLINIRKKIGNSIELGVILPEGFLDDKEFDTRDPSELEDNEIKRRLRNKLGFSESLQQRLQLRGSDE